MTKLHAGSNARSRPLGFPRNLTSWGMSTVLTGPPGSYSCAAGSIADRRNTLPLAFNVRLGDYSSLEAEQKSRSKRFHSARRSAGVYIEYYIEGSKSIVTIMRRGRREYVAPLICNLTTKRMAISVSQCRRRSAVQLAAANVILHWILYQTNNTERR